MEIPPSHDRQSVNASGPEAGFMMVFAIVMVALVLIALAVAAPVVAKNLQRDKELESEHRAQQYVRAIRLYYRKFKTYPPTMDALQTTNNIRFLRKQYVDPLTGKNDWRIIHVGENKTTVKGFFGQPLGGLNTTGAGGLGSANDLLSKQTNNGCTALNTAFCPPGGSPPPSTPSTTSSSTLGSGGVGQIMGVGTSKTGDSILNPNQQTTYETWEFIYDPKIEMLYQQANMLGGPASVNSQPLSNNPLGGLNNTTPNQPAPTTPAPSTPAPN